MPLKLSKCIISWLKPYSLESIDKFYEHRLKDGFDMIRPWFLDLVKKDLEKIAINISTSNEDLSKKILFVTKNIERDFYQPINHNQLYS